MIVDLFPPLPPTAVKVLLHCQVIVCHLFTIFLPRWTWVPCEGNVLTGLPPWENDERREKPAG